jgi:hypothetical protein
LHYGDASMRPAAFPASSPMIGILLRIARSGGADLRRRAGPRQRMTVLQTRHDQVQQAKAELRVLKNTAP